METLHVFCRSVQPGDARFLDKMLKAAGLGPYLVIDLALQEPPKCLLAVAMGKVAGRLVKDHVDRLVVLPSIEQMSNKETGNKMKMVAWEQLKEVKQLLQSKALEPSQVADQASDVVYELLTIGEKTVCVYDRTRPPVKADIFLKKEEAKILLAIRDIFRAESVRIDKE